MTRRPKTISDRWHAKPSEIRVLSDGRVGVTFDSLDQRSPRVTIVFREDAGRAVLDAVGLDDVVKRDGGLGTEDLRIPLARIAAVAVDAVLAQKPDPAAPLPSWWGDPKALERAQRTLAKRGSKTERFGARSRKKVPDDHYRRIAIRYLQLYAGGMTKGILRTISQEEQVSETTARDWVRKARELKYLSPGRQGAAGAQPGPRLDLFDLTAAGLVHYERRKEDG